LKGKESAKTTRDRKRKGERKSQAFYDRVTTEL